LTHLEFCNKRTRFGTIDFIANGKLSKATTFLVSKMAVFGVQDGGIVAILDSKMAA
jgi:hypothetical protein